MHRHDINLIFGPHRLDQYSSSQVRELVNEKDGVLVAMVWTLKLAQRYPGVPIKSEGIAPHSARKYFHVVVDAATLDSTALKRAVVLLGDNRPDTKYTLKHQF